MGSGGYAASRSLSVQFESSTVARDPVNGWSTFQGRLTGNLGCNH